MPENDSLFVRRIRSARCATIVLLVVDPGIARCIMLKPKFEMVNLKGRDRQISTLQTDGPTLHDQEASGKHSSQFPNLDLYSFTMTTREVNS